MTFADAPGSVDGIDCQRLGRELSTLLLVLRGRAITREQLVALGHVVAAQKAAERGDAVSAFGYLKTAGHWFWEIADIVGFSMTLEMLDTPVKEDA